MKYRVVLWDFDGTLADTFACTVRVYNRLAPTYGTRPIDDPQAARAMTLSGVRRALGISLRKLPFLVRAVLAGQKEEITTVPLFPGLAAVLEGISRVGCRMSVLSSNAEGNIRACLGANGVEALFDAVVGYRRLFGKGRGIRRFLRAQRIPRGDALYVGDEVRDIEAARQAGVAVAAVTWGYQAREVLAGQGPDFLADSPEELLGLLG